MNIENKTVLVTGSTDGVCRVVARRLADQGARVLIHGRDRMRGEQLLNKIRAADRGSAVFLPADFSSWTCKARTGDSPSISPVNVSVRQTSTNAGLAVWS